VRRSIMLLYYSLAADLVTGLVVGRASPVSSASVGDLEVEPSRNVLEIVDLLFLIWCVALRRLEFDSEASTPSRVLAGSRWAHPRARPPSCRRRRACRYRDRRGRQLLQLSYR